MGRMNKGWSNKSLKQWTGFQSGKKEIEGGYDKFINSWVVSK